MRTRVPVVLVVATALGLWLGLTAPDTSPVLPDRPTAGAR